MFAGGTKRKWAPGEGQENQSASLTAASATLAAKRQKSVQGTSPSKILARPVTLNREQNAVLQAVMSGRSVFFTGSAGTGKSFLLKRIIGGFICLGLVFVWVFFHFVLFFNKLTVFWMLTTLA